MRPAIHKGIQILRRGPDSFLLFDPGHGARFEVDGQTHYLVRLLDGTRTVERVAEDFGLLFGREIPLRQVREFIEQLRLEGLLAGEQPPAAGPSAPAVLPEPAPSVPSVPSATVANRVFDWLAVVFGWAVHPVMIVPIVAATVLAVTALIRGWDRYQTTVVLFWSDLPPLPLAAAMLVTPLLLVLTAGAIATGVACRTHRGRIRRFGTHLYRGVVPLIICDPGESFLWMGRRGRWTLLTVRIWTQLAVGSAAALLWAAAPLGSGVGLLAAFVVVPCAIGTASNAIVTLPRDGYRILSYLWCDSRLRERALAETRAWLAGRISPEALSSAERRRLRRFGLGIYATHALLYAGLFGFGSWWLVDTLGASGAVIALGAGVWFFYEQIKDAFRRAPGVATLARFGGSGKFRGSVRLSVLVLSVVILLLPYDYEVTGPCQVVPASRYGARAQVAGEIEKIHAREGDVVEAGALLATLYNPMLAEGIPVLEAELVRGQAELALLEAGSRNEDLQIARREVQVRRSEFEIAQIEFQREEHTFRTDTSSAARHDRARSRREVAEQQLSMALEALGRLEAGHRREEIAITEARIGEIEAKLARAHAEKALLSITSRISGRVVTPNLDDRIGQYAQPGDLILVVEDDQHLRVEVAAEESAGAQVAVGSPASVRIHGLHGGWLGGTVANVSLKADEHTRFDTVRSDREQFLQESLDLAESHNTFRVSIDLEEHSETVRPGMTGFARIYVREEVFGRALLRPVLRFFRTEVWSWLP